jgi:DNA-binding response OmpR family regulator
LATVLIIDDDIALTRLVSLVLRTDGIDVRSAMSGEEGLELLDRAGHPDLIVLDLSVPQMGGREFYRQARLGGYQGPVLVCSAFGAVAANQELGAQGAVEKPFDPDELLDRVRGIIGAD